MDVVYESCCGLDAHKASVNASVRRTDKSEKVHSYFREFGTNTAEILELSAQYRHLAARRGRKKAAVAVAHIILQSIYHMLTRREPYRYLGPDYFDKLGPKRLTRYLVKRLERLGHRVTLQPAA